MDPKTKKIFDRIQKLLNLALNNSNEHEAASAMASAQRLMAKYNFSEADFIIGEVKKDENITNGAAIHWTYNSPGLVPVWMQTLVVGIARINECESNLRGGNWLMPEGHYQSGWRIVVYGYDPDVQLTQMLVHFIVAQIEGAAHRFAQTDQAKRQVQWGGKSMQHMKRYYREGMVNRILDRMRAQAELTKREAQVENPEAFNSTGTSLVLLSKKEAVTLKFGEFEYDETESLSDLDLSTLQAMLAGETDAEDININASALEGK